MLFLVLKLKLERLMMRNCWWDWKMRKETLWGNGGSTEKARAVRSTVAVALGNTDIHCVEINCIMDNTYQTRRNKVKEAMPKHWFLREIKEHLVINSHNQPVGGAQGPEELVIVQRRAFRVKKPWGKRWKSVIWVEYLLP